MAINRDQLKIDLTDYIKQALADYTNATVDGAGVDANNFEAFAAIMAEAMARVAEHIKDDADVTGVTSGSDTVIGGVE